MKINEIITEGATKSGITDVLYHGSNQPVTKFKIPAYGAFFSPHKEWAENYGDVLTAVKIHAPKIYVLDHNNRQDYAILDALFDRDYVTVAKAVKLLQSRGYHAMQTQTDSEMVCVFPGTKIQVVNEVAEDVNLPKDQWELLISTADKEEVGDELVGLVQNAYATTPEGSFVNSLKDVIPSDWQVIDWDGDTSINATVFYRVPRGNENWVGYKIQGLGHDGQRQSKDRAIKKMIQMLETRGYWLEGSDAMRAVLKKFNVPAVQNEQFLQRLFGDSQLRMIDQDTYQRRLSNRVITESVFGKPILR